MTKRDDEQHPCVKDVFKVISILKPGKDSCLPKSYRPISLRCHTYKLLEATIKTTALPLSYSTAEYTCPVWERSTHVRKLDPALNEACRSITGCLRPTSVENVYLLAGIAPPGVTRVGLPHLDKNNSRPVWERSTHVRKLDPALNEACRSITGCLRPTSVENVYLLAGIAPPGVTRVGLPHLDKKKNRQKIPCIPYTITSL